MPYTVIVYLWRKLGTTPSEFKSHYEKNHMPLFASLTGSLFPLTHTRYYLRHKPEKDSSSVTAAADYQPIVYAGSHSDFDYDVLCVMKFEDQASFEAFSERMKDPEVAAKIAADDEIFMNRQIVWVAAVDEPEVSVGPCKTLDQ